MRTSLVIAGTVLAILLAIGTLLDSQGAPSAQGGAPAWQPFEQAIVAARQENKKLLIDVYTDWCGWCKRMDAEVYANPEVLAALEEEFIPVKLNAESSTEFSYLGTRMTQIAFARAAGVTGYPTTLFLDAEGRPITRVPGFVPSDRFLAILRYIGQDHYQRVSFEDFLRHPAPVN